MKLFRMLGKARHATPLVNQSTIAVDVTAKPRERTVMDHGCRPADRPLDLDLTGFGAVVDHIRQHHLRSAELTPARAAEILAAHNNWRRDLNGTLPYSGNGKELGEAIDVVVDYVRRTLGALA